MVRILGSVQAEKSLGARDALRRQNVTYVQAVSSFSSCGRTVRTDPTMLRDTAISKGKKSSVNECTFI